MVTRTLWPPAFQPPVSDLGDVRKICQLEKKKERKDGD